MGPNGPDASQLEAIIPIIAIAGGLIFVTILVLVKSVGSMLHTRQREQTKREIAAYIAEGSMTPEQGERIIKADMPHWERDRKG